MSIVNVDRRRVFCLLVSLAFFSHSLWAQDDPMQLFAWLQESVYAERVEHREKNVRAHLVGLDRINKVRGTWNPEKLERVSGHMVSSTWRMREGVTSAAMFEDAAAVVEDRPDARLLFSCEERGCGPSVQWANLVFGQRILYGTEVSQLYRVWALGGPDEDTHRVMIYASARSSDRQYMHTEIIELAR